MQNDTDPPTPALNAQILPIQNGSLMPLIARNSQGNMFLWFDFCVKNI